MKIYIKNCICILLSVIMVLSLFACKKNQKTPEDGEALTVDLLSSYTIVIPDNASKEIKNTALSLMKYIKEITGTEVTIKSDLIIKNSDEYRENEYEIILGNANREASIEFHKSIRENDTGYAMVGKKIIIIGYQSEVIDKSLLLFKQNVLDNAGKGEILLHSGESKVIAGTYTYDIFKLNGTDIYKYTIVYPKSNTNNEMDIAQRLAKWINIKTGYKITTTSDTVEKSEYEIQIGKTNRITSQMESEMNEKVKSNNHYYITSNEGMVWLMGKNSNGILSATTEMCNMISIKDRNATLNIEKVVCKEINSLSLSLMSYNIRSQLNDPRNPDDVIKSIEIKNPDIFGVQEAVPAWIVKLNTAFTSKYTCVKGLGNDSTRKECVAIYFKTDKYELVESGTKWLSETPNVMSKPADAIYYKIVTYAVIRDKSTGIEFLYANLHYDTSGYIVRTLQSKVLAEILSNYPLMPMIVGGDFNTDPTTSPIKTLLSLTRLKLGKEIAEESIVGPSTVTKDYLNRGDKEIDIIFVTGESISVQKYEIWDNKMNGKYPSDHLPVCVDLTITM